MNIGSILFIIAVMLLSILYVAYPYLKENQNNSKPKDEKKAQVLKLLEQRERIIFELDELDLDYQANKINEKDYLVMRKEFLQAAAGVMHQLEEIGYTDEQQQKGLAMGFERNDEYEMLITNRRRVRQEKTSGFCPKCGAPLQKSDMFCPKCGEVIRDFESE